MSHRHFLYEAVDVLGSSTSVGPSTTGNPRYLRFRSRHLTYLPTKSEEQLWYLHIMYGASLRSLFLYAHRPDAFDGIVISEINELSPGGLVKLLVSGNSASDDSHLLVTTRPSSTDRGWPERKITSRYVLYRRTLRNQVEMMEELYDTLRTFVPTNFSGAGMIFEYTAHKFLQEGPEDSQPLPYSCLFPTARHNALQIRLRQVHRRRDVQATVCFAQIRGTPRRQRNTTHPRNERLLPPPIGEGGRPPLRYLTRCCINLRFCVRFVRTAGESRPCLVPCFPRSLLEAVAHDL